MEQGEVAVLQPATIVETEERKQLSLVDLYLDEGMPDFSSAMEKLGGKL